MAGDASLAAPEPPSTSARQRQNTQPDWIKTCFIGVLAIWVLLPIGASADAAQDAIPSAVAGRLVAHHPGDVYPAPPDPHSGIHRRFAREYCALIGVTGDRCDAIEVAYLATPLALPFAIVIGHTSAWTASLLMRLGAAIMLAAGMALLWNRVAHRTRFARLQLLVAPLVELHYLWVPLGCLAVVLADQARVDDRLLAVRSHTISRPPIAVRPSALRARPR